MQALYAHNHVHKRRIVGVLTISQAPSSATGGGYCWGTLLKQRFVVTHLLTINDESSPRFKALLTCKKQRHS